MARPKKSENKEAAPVSQVITDNNDQNKKSTRYVVVRDGFRVSDKEYENPTNPECVNEIEFWTKVANNHSYGEKVEAVIYDSKLHRVW
jgi:hypothetical protein